LLDKRVDKSSRQRSRRVQEKPAHKCRARVQKEGARAEKKPEEKED
jgi:hypothetical protein